MSQENPNAFKFWISDVVVNKYFSAINLNKKDIKNIVNQLKTLELKQRVQLISSELRKALPEKYESALIELMKITREKNLKSFELWPATEFIQTYGLNHIDESLGAMYELTQKFTAEFSIRPFVNKYGDEIYSKISRWKNDPNDHIRRWLSEGTRPRLPWGEKLHSAVKNPNKGLEILEALKFDKSLYVRKSVANHLNDIAKDHPDVVVKTLLKWKRQVPKNYQSEFNFLAHRALRTLIKDGHAGALEFTGVSIKNNNLHITQFKIKKNKVKMGKKLEFSFSLKNRGTEKEKYIIDYVIYFKKANGGLSSKVFKLKTAFLNASEKILINKNYNFKPITTRKYYQGEHKLALKLNGREQKSTSFKLLALS